MILNTIVAFSNLPAVLPIYSALKKKDFITTSIIIFVATFSTISHLVENHKHGMVEIGFSTNFSYLTNRLDVIGAILTFGRFFYMFIKKYGFSQKIFTENPIYMIIQLLLFCLLRISEFDKYNANLRNMYVVTHCFWHIGIYVSMNYAIQYIL